jgi:hypothetical protein
MRVQRGGRKRIVAPDGNELASATSRSQMGALVKALARAWRWQRMLDGGPYTSVSEISEAENIGKPYVSRLLRLALLPHRGGDTGQASRPRADLNQLERPNCGELGGAAASCFNCVAQLATRIRALDLGCPSGSGITPDRREPPVSRTTGPGKAIFLESSNASLAGSPL